MLRVVTGRGWAPGLLHALLHKCGTLFARRAYKTRPLVAKGSYETRTIEPLDRSPMWIWRRAIS